MKLFAISLGSVCIYPVLTCLVEENSGIKIIYPSNAPIIVSDFESGIGIVGSKAGKVQIGQKYFGISFGELGDEFLAFQRGRVESGKITEGRLGTIRSQITRHILPYIGVKTKVGSITSSAFYDYAQYRRKISKGVQKVSIRNEYTTVGALLKFAARLGYVNFPIKSLDFEEIKIAKGEIGRRDTFTPQEYDWGFTRPHMNQLKFVEIENLRSRSLTYLQN